MSVYKLVIAVPVVINVAADSMKQAEQLARDKTKALFDNVKSPDYGVAILEAERMTDQ